MTAIVVFDTCTKPPYYKDVHQLLALPQNSYLRYDYEEKLFSAEALEILTKATLDDMPIDAFLFYGQFSNYAKGAPDPNGSVFTLQDSILVPTRYARVRNVALDKRVGGDGQPRTNVIFHMELLGFPDPDAPAIPTLMEILSERKEMPFSKWIAAAPSDLDLSGLQQESSDLWGKVVGRLARTPSQFNGDVFWRVHHLEKITGDPNGSQRAWDLYVKSRFVATKNPGRALVLASGTPITNTLGEMFTVQRLMDFAALMERGLHEFDAWASTFGDTVTELELQPSGKYKPVSRFASFVNVPELIAMFRSFADVVMPEDLRQYVKVPAISTGKRQIVTSKPTPDFKKYQMVLASRIKAIEERNRPPEPCDDILLSVITDGRHAAIDLRLVDPDNDNEPDNKLNKLIVNAFRIWRETAENSYVRADGKPYELPGAAQMIFSDLGTISVEKTRGFSAYRWIRDELIRLGVPASEIAFMQDYKKSEAKQRLFGDTRAGKVRFLIGSSETMGTGVNAQLRLKALHHLDVPWLPSQIEQREGRIARQGNQHDEIDIYAYATEGSLDATMWQNNERKARFIAAALSGDTSIRRLEDLGEGQANQFAMAKAIASGDQRLMQKAGLEADIARLERLRAAHIDDQHAVRRQLRDAEREIEHCTGRIGDIGHDIERLVPTAGDAFAVTVAGKPYRERKEAGRALMREILTLVQRQQEGETVIASIGGFDLEYAGERAGRDGYRYSTMLLRTGAQEEIELPITVTPLGAVSRLEHAIDGFESERERHRQHLADAQRRLASYKAHGDGGDFAFASELADKRRQLAEIEAALAKDIDGIHGPAAIAA